MIQNMLLNSLASQSRIIPDMLDCMSWNRNSIQVMRLLGAVWFFLQLKQLLKTKKPKMLRHYRQPVHLISIA